MISSGELRSPNHIKQNDVDLQLLTDLVHLHSHVLVVVALINAVPRIDVCEKVVRERRNGGKGICGGIFELKIPQADM